jgi:lipoprotein signal peptidase
MFGCAPDGLEREMLFSMRSRRTILVGIALVFASIDLVHKSFDLAEFHHARTQLVALVIAALVAALIVLVPRIPSNAAAVGAGVACGGALGNVVSLLAWRGGVPDPLILANGTHLVAFNLADVFALTGDALLLTATVMHGLRHRARLLERA